MSYRSVLNVSNGGPSNPKLTLKINSLRIKRKAQNFASWMLNEYAFKIRRKKGKDFFDHSTTLKIQCLTYNSNNVPAIGGPLAKNNKVTCNCQPRATGTFKGLTHVIMRTLSVVINKPSQNPYITTKTVIWT